MSLEFVSQLLISKGNMDRFRNLCKGVVAALKKRPVRSGGSNHQAQVHLTPSDHQGRGGFESQDYLGSPARRG